MNKKKRQAKPWDLIDPRIEAVPESVSKYRYEICLSCPLLNKVTKTCYACGCFMKLKTTLPDAFCPKHKWDVYEKA